jgi:hypothetical protein
MEEFFSLEGNLKNAYSFLSEKRGAIRNSGSHRAGCGEGVSAVGIQPGIDG